MTTSTDLGHQSSSSTTLAKGTVHSRRFSSDIKAPIHCKPNGRPLAAYPAGREIAGIPAWVQGKFISGLPVLLMPLGAGPGAEGQIHKSIPDCAMRVCNSVLSLGGLARKAGISSALASRPSRSAEAVRGRYNGS